MHVSDGTIWCSGKGLHGQLGIDMSDDYRTTFEEVPGLKKIIAVHCGSCTCTAMNEDRAVSPGVLFIS